MINIRFFILLFHLLVFSVQAIEITKHDFQKEQATSNQQCTSCHQQSQHDWQQSDHAKAMAIATKESVLADFKNVDIKHYGQKSSFFC